MKSMEHNVHHDGPLQTLVRLLKGKQNTGSQLLDIINSEVNEMKLVCTCWTALLVTVNVLSSRTEALVQPFKDRFPRLFVPVKL